MLLKYAQITNGPILELGAGLHSTPLLHWLCAESNRKLITYESNLTWFKYAKEFQSRNHSIRLAENWDEIDFIAPLPTANKKSNKRWSVVFIDHELFAELEEMFTFKTRDKKISLSMHAPDNIPECVYIDTIRLKNHADYIILHDTNDVSVYNYDEVWKHFKYVHHWTYCIPNTSVVSNFKKLNKLSK